MRFNEARIISRMTLLEISKYLDISVRTLQRYQKTNNSPKSVTECLLMIGGHIPSYSLRNDFTGWSFGRGFLWSPEGNRFTSGDVYAGSLALLEMNRQHRLEVRNRRSVKLLKSSNVVDITPYLKQVNEK